MTATARASFVTAPLVFDATLAGLEPSSKSRGLAADEPILPPEVRSFLARARLLEGVPFQHLVPDSELLPPETIRFFFLDRNWTDTLVEGALSVGTVTTVDHQQLELLHAAIRNEVDAEERQLRLVEGEVVSGGNAGPVTGFLLRSRVVSGWPALHVRGYRANVLPDDADIDFHDSRRLRLLRLERLAPAVLLCLFDGLVVNVHIEEPRAGVQYGIDVGATGRTVRLRDVTSATFVDQSPLVKPPFTVRVPMRVASTSPTGGFDPNLGVVAVRHLAERMAAVSSTKISIASVLGITSAEVALELVRFPYRQVFGPGGKSTLAADAPDSADADDAFRPTLDPESGAAR